MTTYTAISLFSGIGAFDYAASVAGFDILAQVEIDEFCRKVLAKHHDRYWCNSTRFADVREFGFAQFPQGRGVNLIFGGFPCQPVSLAGKRLGKDDSRYLWGEFARIIGELRPRAVLLENVSNIVNLEGTGVIADLTALGYDAKWGIISASDAGAPHRRERWWCVAYDNIHRLEARTSETGQNKNDAQRVNSFDILGQETHLACGTSDTAQTFHSNMVARYGDEPRLARNINGARGGLDKHRFPARPFETPHEDEPPRFVPRKTVKNWTNRVKAIGNALVPQVAYPLFVEIYKQLQKMDGVAW